MSFVLSYTNLNLVMVTLAEVASITTLSASAATQMAAAAQTEINAKLAGKYALPFSVDIPILETLCTDMAVYRILTGRVIITEEDPWFDRFSKDPPKLLQSIVDGDTKLVTTSFEVIEPSTGVAAGGAPYSNQMDYPPTHSELPWTQHVQDPDKIDELAEERDLDTVGDLLK